MEVIQVDLSQDLSSAAKRAVAVLQNGGVIAYPTDTIYGLGVNALDEKAIRRIFSVKRRDERKSLPIAVKNILWAKELAYITQRNEHILDRIWPGKVTAVFPKKGIIPNILTGGEYTIGMRIVKSDFVDMVLGKFGYPITATSANISESEPIRDGDTVVKMFQNNTIQPDLIINAGVLPESDPSTVVDLTTDKPKILRIGATKPKQLLKLLDGL